VRATTLDALANCYKVSIIEELRREVSPETTAKAWQEMREKGIAIIGELDIEKIEGMSKLNITCR